ncbi:hypothetical protein [Albibacillus kandeliae]|uniref:hypothetical protein n=1 Tax=Albibacillus kandeliae TaxID=2174228 RepID=UPI000D68859E|nr:hypothetical protein [Albibacillus kandeliae]
MPIFFLSADLNHEDGEAHYTALFEELKKMRGHRVMNHAFLVHVRTESPKQLLEHLRPFHGENDRLFALRVHPAHSFYQHAYPRTNEWLDQHFKVDRALAERADVDA